MERDAIPADFVIAGIRVRSKGKMTKETCHELLGDLVENMKRGGEQLKESLENGEVIE